MALLKSAVEHLIHNVLPAAADYDAAERELSDAYGADESESAWEFAARKAKRRAAELAIAIDGLTDRSSNELGISKNTIRNQIEAVCYWPGSTTLRQGAHDRVRGIANAYKHCDLSDPTLPIVSDSDVLVIGLGFGLAQHSHNLLHRFRPRPSRPSCGL